jgi:hypothetical protein
MVGLRPDAMVVPWSELGQLMRLALLTLCAQAAKLQVMKKQDAIRWAGGSPSQLAAIFEITPSAVSQWGKALPQARVWQLRVLRPLWFNADGTPKAPTARQQPQRV